MNSLEKPPCQCTSCKLSRRFDPFREEIKTKYPEVYDIIDELWCFWGNEQLDHDVLQAKLDGSWPDYWEYSKRLELLHSFAPPNDLTGD